MTSGRIGKDKILHFLVCFGLMLGLGLVMHIIFALLITIIIAVTKEVWDYLGKKQVDIMDFAVDVAGIMFGIIIILIIGGMANI